MHSMCASLPRSAALSAESAGFKVNNATSTQNVLKLYVMTAPAIFYLLWQLCACNGLLLTAEEEALEILFLQVKRRRNQWRLGFIADIETHCNNLMFVFIVQFNSVTKPVKSDEPT